MRRILIEKARRKNRVRHGGGLERVKFDEANVAAMMPSDQLLALDDALQGLEQADPEAAQLVKLRFYAGLTHEKACETLGISRRAADRLWAFGRAWLYEALRRENCGSEVQRPANFRWTGVPWQMEDHSGERRVGATRDRDCASRSDYPQTP
jgi:DNA-directed RNA polymerase specialized sigma24 family protein